MTQEVEIQYHGNIAVVTLNRPDVLNAMSPSLMKALVAAFNHFQSRPELAAVVLTGAGRGFCAGLDLEALSAEGGLDNFTLSGEYDIQQAILSFDRPVIGAINGVAATGGFELALWCDLLIGCESSRFIDTHARVGLVPGWGLSQRLPRLIGINRARQVSLTGNKISAEQALAWGLLNEVVPAENLLERAIAIAQEIAECHQATVIRYKRVINEGYAMDMAAALKYERFAMDLHAVTQQGADIAARKEGVKARNRS